MAQDQHFALELGLDDCIVQLDALYNNIDQPTRSKYAVALQSIRCRLVAERFGSGRIAAAVASSSAQRSATLETFLEQYLARTGKTIDELQLVEQADVENGLIRYWVEDKPVARFR